jgi:hypothetical protein
MEFNMATGTQTQGARDQGSPREESQGVYQQATDAMSNVADRASDMWEEAYDRGARYYRNADGSAIGSVIVGGLVGYALAYLIHGYQSGPGRGWSTTSHDYGRDPYRSDFR